MSILSVTDYLQKNFNISFTKQQLQGVNEITRNCLLLAVPGSGKTTVLVSRLANLILYNKVSVKEILTLTFSRETSKDIKARFLQLFGDQLVSTPKISTIHSFCLSVMRTYAKRYNRQLPNIISTLDNGSYKKRVLREIYQKINHEYMTDDILDYAEKTIGYVKNMMYSSERLKQEKFEVENFTEIYEAYENYKKSNKLIDFDDMLTYTYDILKKFAEIRQYYQQRYKYINVDEAQDTTKIQHEIIKLISCNSVVFMVGDEDQTIYSFLGAYPRQLLDFQLHYNDAIILKMEQNFRSNSDIVLKANNFIKRNKIRYDKNMFCDNQNDKSLEIIEVNDFSNQYDKVIEIIKSAANQPKSIAVLYRNNDSAIAIIDKLLQENITFYLKEHTASFFNSMLIRDIKSFTNLAYNRCDLDAFKQIYYKIGLPKTLFTFVADNISNYNDIFDCLLDYDLLDDKRRYQVNMISKNFTILSKKTAIGALDFIEREMGYKRYIIQKYGLFSFTGISAMQKLNILKSIASKSKSLYDLATKLSSLCQTLQQNTFNQKEANVYLSTIHSSKGLEFDTVVLVDIIENILPTADAVFDEADGNLEPIESEARLFYVAVTRAKTKLFLFNSDKINGEQTKVSPFVTQFAGLSKLKFDIQQSGAFIGQELVHNLYGNGVIISQKNDIITVRFKDLKTDKTLSYNSCMERNIIKLK